MLFFFVWWQVKVSSVGWNRRTGEVPKSVAVIIYRYYPQTRKYFDGDCGGTYGRSRGCLLQIDIITYSSIARLIPPTHLFHLNCNNTIFLYSFYLGKVLNEHGNWGTKTSNRLATFCHARNSLWFLLAK